MTLSTPRSPVFVSVAEIVTEFSPSQAAVSRVAKQIGARTWKRILAVLSPFLSNKNSRGSSEIAVRRLTISVRLMFRRRRFSIRQAGRLRVD